MDLDQASIEAIISDMKRLDNIKQQLGGLRWRVEEKNIPVFHRPTGSDGCEKLGVEINMPGKEVALLLDAILDDPDDYEIEALKKLLLVAKLKHPGATITYKDELRRAQDRFDREMAGYIEAKTKYDKLNADLDSILLDAKFVDVSTTWAEMIDQLEQQVKAVDNQVELLAEPHARFFKLVLRSSKHVRMSTLPDHEGEADVNWSALRDKLKLEHINTMLRKWIVDLNNGRPIEP